MTKSSKPSDSEIERPNLKKIMRIRLYIRWSMTEWWKQPELVEWEEMQAMRKIWRIIIERSRKRWEREWKIAKWMTRLKKERE